MRPSRWGVGLLGIAGGAMALFMYLAFGSAFSSRLFQRPVAEPAAEEYAVFSGFLNDFFSSNHWFPVLEIDHSDHAVYLGNTTSAVPSPGSIIPLDVVALGSEEMGRDFYRKNLTSWPLTHAPESRIQVVLVDPSSALLSRRRFEGIRDHPTRACDVGDPDKSYGLMKLSRAGFNRDKNLALLHFAYYCGQLAGQGGWVLLRKDGAQWRVKGYGSGWIS